MISLRLKRKSGDAPGYPRTNARLRLLNGGMKGRLQPMAVHAEELPSLRTSKPTITVENIQHQENIFVVFEGNKET